MRLVVVRSLTGLALYTAAIDSGALPRARTAFAIANLADIPEVTPGPHLSPSGAGMVGRDDAVVDLGAAMHPYHPAVHEPPRRDRYALTAHLVQGAGGEEVDELVVPDATSRPMRTVLDLFPHVPTTVIPDSLEHYASTSRPTAADLGRIAAVLHGLAGAPVAKGFADVPSEPLDADAVRTVLATHADEFEAHLDSTVILETPQTRGPGDVAARMLEACGEAALDAIAASPSTDPRVVLALDPDAAPRHVPSVLAPLAEVATGASLSGHTLPRAALAVAARGWVVGGPSLELALGASLGSGKFGVVGPAGDPSDLRGDAAHDMPLLVRTWDETRRAMAPSLPGPMSRRGLRRLATAAIRRARKALG
ncbi:hypothetical protein [Demequina sp. NBRC 110054]|uniref:hypothetical protein n=1 Tax=Demequina sp. NBRC 110054 TaxID=1570343 RepID=UPI000A052D93|nr:hypothetical protein [Demequina sp. NBRC 110054]